MLGTGRAAIAGFFLVGASALTTLGVSHGLGAFAGQTDNSGNAFTTAPSFTNAGYHDPSTEAATSGGNNDGFELNPTYAYADDAFYAANAGGPWDRHFYYNFNVAPPAGSTIEGIRVRLDWWLDSVVSDTGMGVELSWDGGITWTSAKTDTTKIAVEHTAVLGGAADTWGRAWTPADLSNTNFRVRITCNCIGSGCDNRVFNLDWVAVNVYYTPP